MTATMFDFPSVCQAYIACRKGKRSSHNTQRYEVRLLDHLVCTSEALLSRRWSPARSVSFVCTRLKAREIHAADFSDRVVHHILVPKLDTIYEPLFIHDSYSHRKNKGTHAAVNRLQGFMRKVSCNGQRKVFFLQLDIRNFFNRINRTTLLKLLQTRLAKALAQHKIQTVEYDDMIWLCSQLLAENAAEKAMRRGSKASFDSVPAYKRLANAPEHCGLAIGNLTSQFFDNVYLNELDQFIKHELKCRYYLRYVDDFVFLHESKAQLLLWREQVNRFLADRLNLELKELSKPVSVSSGCDFLGYVTRPQYKLVRRRVFLHCLEKLDALQQEMVRQHHKGLSLHLRIDFRDRLQASLASYFGHFQHASAVKLEQMLFMTFPWLKLLFELNIEEKHKLTPRWMTVQVRSFQGQISWFESRFSNFMQLVQVGNQFACFEAELTKLNLGLRQRMEKSDSLSDDKAVYTAPLSMLKATRACLRHAGFAHIFITEEGLLPSGLKQRVLRLLWQPHQTSLKVHSTS